MPSIAELAAQFSARLVGDGQVEVSGLAPLSEASPHHLAFLANPLYRKEALNSKAGCLIVSEADYEFLSHPEITCKTKNFLVTQNPYALFARISQGFEKK
jgi:UDP-3-O-[3-hydroxymyristoyl] glucosamine N-acyltransferase